MSKGFATQSKRSIQNFATIQDVDSGKKALDVIQHGFYVIPSTSFTIASFDEFSIEVVAHDARITDQLRINTITYIIIEIVDVDNLVLSEKVQYASIGDDVEILRPTSQVMAEDGSFITSTGPIQFIQDTVSVKVTQDTADPTNNIGLPVELVGASGDINITAGDINVQTSHTEANPDSVQLGDGTTLLGITLANEAKVSDASSLAELQAILAKIIVLPATEAKQDDIISAISLEKSIIDFLDAGLLDSSSSNIPTTGVSVVASLASDCNSVEIFEDLGEYMTLRDGAGSVLAYLPLGGGKVTVSIPALTELKLFSEIGTTITSGKIAMNFIS